MYEFYHKFFQILETVELIYYSPVTDRLCTERFEIKNNTLIRENYEPFTITIRHRPNEFGGLISIYDFSNIYRSRDATISMP